MIFCGDTNALCLYARIGVGKLLLIRISAILFFCSTYDAVSIIFWWRVYCIPTGIFILYFVPPPSYTHRKFKQQVQCGIKLVHWLSSHDFVLILTGILLFDYFSVCVCAAYWRKVDGVYGLLWWILRFFFKRRWNNVMAARLV